jgi:hypothetical protein
VAFITGVSGLAAIYFWQWSGTLVLSTGLAVLEVSLCAVGLYVAIIRFKKGDKESLHIAGKAARVLAPFLALTIFVMGSTVLEVTWEGLQTTVTTTLLVLGIFAFTFVPNASSYAFTAVRWMPRLGAILSVLVFWGIAVPDFALIPADRPLGLALLVPMALALAMPATHWIDRINPYVIYAGIFLTESRTHSDVEFFIIGFVVLRDIPRITKKKMLIKSGVVYLGAAVFAVASFVVSPSLRNRYTEEGDGGLAIPFVPLPASTPTPSLPPSVGPAPAIPEGGLALNTNGSPEVWEWLLSLPQGLDWVWGKGSGFASEILHATRPGNFEYPHNEYIRFLIDLGIIGLVLLLAGFTSLSYFLLKRNGKLFRSPLVHAALLVIVALLALSTTDNPLLRIYVLGPAALVIGLAVRERAAEQVDTESQRKDMQGAVQGAVRARAERPGL